MLESSIAHDIIAEGCDLGADFVDLFVENQVISTLSFSDRKVKEINSGTDFGIGIRVIFGHEVYYGYTNMADRDELLRVLRLLCVGEAKGSSKSSSGLSAHCFIPSQMSIEKGLDSDFDTRDKLAFMSRIDDLARKQPLIEQVDISSIQRWQKIAIFNSEGLDLSSERHYTRLVSTAIAREGKEQARSFQGPGASRGWEFVESLNPEEIAEAISKQAVTVLKADPCPAGRMPVIIDNGFGGVIFHEACGHLLETTSVEKKASVFHDKMGEVIANPAVSAVDDGTIDGEWGSLPVDDEGTPTQKTQLIKDGKLRSFLVDRVGELKTGYKRTGSARRQSYKYAPASRMRNTYIEPGPHSLDDMIASIDNGLFAKSMGGGSVTPGTGDFNFAVQEAYLIRNGKIDRPVKGATLIGSGPETLTKISMAGSDLKLAPGMCGSVSGAVPVTVGQPAIKVDDILVGGES